MARIAHRATLFRPVLHSERGSFIDRSYYGKWNRAFSLRQGLFRRIERTRTTPEMFVAIIICLRGHRYKREATRTHILRLRIPPPSPTPVCHGLKPCSFFSLDLAVLSLDFSTSTCYRAWHEPRSVLPAFRRTCAELSGCAIVREDGGNPGADGEESPWGQTREGTRTPETYVSRKTYAPKAGDKQERGRELVLRIGSVT